MTANSPPAGGVEFVDAHHHFQDLGANLYPWLADPNAPWKLEGDLAPIRRDYGPDDLRADLSGVRLIKSIHVQNGWDARDPVGETLWLDGVAERSGLPTAIVAFADLADPKVDAVLEQHCRSPAMRGIRQILNWHENPVLTVVDDPGLMASADWRRGFARLSAYGLSFDLQIYAAQMEGAFDLACAFPDTSIILNHFGMPVDRSHEGVASWSAAMARLARAPNVSVKLSGFGLGRRNWTVDETGPLLLRVIEQFGVDRCLAGSNLPFDRLYAPPSRIVEGLRWLAAELGPDDARLVLRANAERIYRI